MATVKGRREKMAAEHGLLQNSMIQIVALAVALAASVSNRDQQYKIKMQFAAETE
jgi:hypothetical protein